MTKEVPRTSVLRDAELNKTLIARLRSALTFKDLQLCPTAADRIELLATTNEQLVATNEALSISNATLIAERDQHWDSFVYWRKEADDRSEQLAAARQDAKEAEAYAEELERDRRKTYEALLLVSRLHSEVEGKLAECEARLGKAVEALENVIGEYDLFREAEYERGLAPLDDEIHEARATLAEIKSHSDEFATQKGESHD